MARYIVITNNPIIHTRHAAVTRFLNTSAIDVLTAARNAVHKGSALLNHPLSGNMRPGINPYKSLLITEPQDQVDFQSLRLIEEALSVYKKNGTVKYKAYNQAMLEDFQAVDLDLTVSAMAGLPAEYL